jgi:predicted transposase/invertase (TIGR01784 family)
MADRYVNPFTDFGFKKLFGEEASKPLLLDFLNAALPLPVGRRITELSFNNSERLGMAATDRGAVFDIFCDTSDQEKIIVEMQKAKQQFFKDRTVFYSSFPIQEQGKAGHNWNFELKAVYCLGLLDFSFDDARKPSCAPKEVFHQVKLKDQNNKVFYDKLTFVYLELPHFTKRLDELESRLDKWLYFLKHLPDLSELPRLFGEDPIFEKAGQTAELAAMGPEDQAAYERSLMHYRDMQNVIDYARDTARAEGEAAGIAKGKAEGKAEGLAEGLASGIAQGRTQALAELIIRQLVDRIGVLPGGLQTRLNSLGEESLLALGVGLGEINSASDLVAWLDKA